MLKTSLVRKCFRQSNHKEVRYVCTEKLSHQPYNSLLRITGLFTVRFRSLQRMKKFL